MTVSPMAGRALLLPGGCRHQGRALGAAEAQGDGAACRGPALQLVEPGRVEPEELQAVQRAG